MSYNFFYPLGQKYKRGVIRTLLTPDFCKFKDVKWISAKIGDLGRFIKGASLSKADISDEGTPFILYCIYRAELATCTGKTCHLAGEFPPPRRRGLPVQKRDHIL